MHAIKIDNIIHAVRVEHEDWVNEAANGSILRSIITTQCNPDQIVARRFDRFNADRFDPDLPMVCAACVRKCAAQARRDLQRDADRVAGYPIGVWDTYHQQVWWKTRDQGWVRVDEMSSQHARRTVAMLRRNATRLAMQIGMAFPAPFPHMGDMATLDYERAMFDTIDQAFDKPAQFVDELPLVRALEARATIGQPSVPALQTASW